MFPPIQHAIELCSIDARANRVRRYILVLSVDSTDAQPYRVSSRWGREGWTMRDLCVRAEDSDTALALMKATLKTRRAHGYVVTHVDPSHPLAGWLVDEGMPTERVDEPPRLFPLSTDTPDSPMQGRLFAN